MTRLVAEDTSSDTITFEDETFPLSKEQVCCANGDTGEVGGVFLEMTHGTNLEVCDFPPTLYRPSPWPESLFEGKEENVFTS